MRKLWIAVIAISLIVAYFITSAVMNRPEPAKSAAASGGVPLPQPSTAGQVVAFLIVIFILIALITWVYKENKGEWKKILLDNAIVALYGVIVLNAIAYILHYREWQEFYNTGTLFWMTNIGIILFVFLVSKKSLAAKIVAGVLAFLILTATTDKMADNNKKRPGVANSRTVTNLSYGTPWAIAGPILADAETGGCVAGKGHHWADEGKKIPVRNPPDAKPGTGAVGMWQINLSSSAVVTELKSLEEEMKKDSRLKKGEKLDVEFNPAHQEAAAKYLYEKYKTDPWTASKNCWEPKLRAYAWGGGGVGEAVVFVVTAPTDKWSESYDLPRNGNRGGRHSIDGFGKKYTIRWNNGYSDQTDENIPGDKVRPKVVYNFSLKSRETESVPITVKFY